MEAVRERLSGMTLAESSWPLRTAAAVLVACTAFRMGPANGGLLEGRLLGPVVACICCSKTLGETLLNSWMVTMGILVGAALGLGTNVSLSWHPASLYATQAILSVSLLYVQMNVVQTKLTWVVLTISIASAIKNLREGDEVDTIRPLQVSLSALYGVAVAVVVNHLPFPSSRATSVVDRLLKEASKQAAAAIEELCHAFAEHDTWSDADRSATFILRKQQHALLETIRAEHIAKAEKCLRQAELDFAKAQKLHDFVWWEQIVKVSLSGPLRAMRYLRFEDSEGPVRGMDIQEKVLANVIMMAGGCLRAIKVSREAEAQHSVPLPQHLLGQAKACKDFGDDECSEDLTNLAKLVATRSERAEHFKTGVASQVLQVGACLSALITMHGDQKGYKTGTKALDDAVTDLDTRHDQIRKELYYSNHADTQRMESLAFNAFGPPCDFLFFCFCLKSCSRTIGEISSKTSEETESKSIESVFTNWKARSVKEMKKAFIMGVPSRIQAARMVYALKLSAASVISMYLGDITSGSGLWAGIAVAVIGPRDSLRGGGSFRVASLRINGTVIGSLFGFFAAMVTEVGNPVGIGHLALLGFWVYLCGFVRSGKSSYGGFVAQFTPFVMIETPASLGAAGFELWAFRRIQQNMIGCIVFVMVEVLIIPTFSSALLKRRLITDLRHASKCARLVWDATMGTPCEKCSDRVQALATTTLEKQGKGIKKQKDMLEEVRHEPEWYVGTEADVRTYDRLIDIEERHVWGLLKLMQVVLERWGQSMRTSENVREHTIAVFSSLECRVKRLKMKVADWFEKIAEDLEKSSLRDGDEYICEEDAVTALHLFELNLFSKVSQIAAQTRARDGDPPPAYAMSPVYSLIFLTRELVRAAAEVSRYSRMVNVDPKQGRAPKICVRTIAELNLEPFVGAAPPTLDPSSSPKARCSKMRRRRSSVSHGPRSWERAKMQGVRSWNFVQRWLEEIQKADEAEADAEVADVNEGGKEVKGQDGDATGGTCPLCGLRTSI